MDMTGKNTLMRSILDAMPIPVFLVDEDVRIIHSNTAAKDLIPVKGGEAEGMRAGDALLCVNSIEEGCGLSGFCGDCVIRNSTYQAFKDTGVRRKKLRMKVKRGDDVRIVNLLVTTAPLSFEGRRMAVLMLEDISDLIQMQRLLPICSKCKKIRNDKGYWEEVDEFIGAHADVDFSHSYCPECARELYPDDYIQKKEDEEK